MAAIVLERIFPAFPEAETRQLACIAIDAAPLFDFLLAFGIRWRAQYLWSAETRPKHKFRLCFGFGRQGRWRGRRTIDTLLEGPLRSIDRDEGDEDLAAAHRPSAD